MILFAFIRAEKRLAKERGISLDEIRSRGFHFYTDSTPWQRWGIADRPNDQVFEVAKRYQSMHQTSAVQGWNSLLERIAHKHGWFNWNVTKRHELRGQIILGSWINGEGLFSDDNDDVEAAQPEYKSREQIRIDQKRRIVEMMESAISEAKGDAVIIDGLLFTNKYGKSITPFTLLESKWPCICGKPIPKSIGWNPRDYLGRYSNGFGYGVDIRHKLCCEINKTPGSIYERKIINLINKVTKNGNRKPSKNNQNIRRSQGDAVRHA